MEAMSARPTWFGLESSPHFGVIHTPAGGRAIGGIVICPPLGKEHIDTYRGLKVLAQQLCERGFAVLRFDYRGTGDSAGELGTDSALDDYRESIRTAVAYLQASGVPRVGVVGLRMGALLAALTVESIAGVGPIVLWDPVVDGRRYLREQRTLYKMTVGADVVETHLESILGSTFSPDCARQFRTMQLPASVGVAAPLLVLARPERADDPRIGALAGQSGCELGTVAAQPEYVEPVTFVVEIPIPTLTLITDWLVRHTVPGDHPVTPVIRRRAEVARLADGRVVVETLEELGPNRLFAITTARSDAASDAPTLLIHSTASEPRIGAGRVWTDAAREFAGHGLTVVRYDRRGTGDTGWATADFATIYSADSDADVRDAMAAIEVPADRLLMTGVCSGAWNSAVGAIRHGARAVVLVNVILYSVRHKAVGPEKLVGLTPPNPGDDARPEARTLEARAKNLVRRWLPYPLWLLLGRLGLTEVPEVLLAALQRRDIVVDMVLSPEDHIWFDKQRGARGLERLAARGWHPSMVLAPTGDHSLQQRDIQKVVRRRLLEVAVREFAGILAESDDGGFGSVASPGSQAPPTSSSRRR